MAATITFRKTRQGDWVAFGPASAVRECTEVTVTKRSGDAKRVYIERTGKTFQVDGLDMVYGYIGSTSSSRRGGHSPHRSSSNRCDRCRCHREPNAGAPGSIMFDGCTYCGCDSDC